jgi:glycosyltransferase involved in cell wall biosynthesis
MRILHLIDSSGLYGAEKMIISLAIEQLKLGLFPVIGSIRDIGISDKPIEVEARKYNLKVQTFDMKPSFNISGIREIIRYAKSENFDIVHSHGYKPNILMGFTPKFIRKIPVVSTLHGWTNVDRWTKMRIYYALEAVALLFVDKIALVSKGMLAKPQLRKISSRKILVINNGIDTSINTPTFTDKKQFISEELTNPTIQNKLLSITENGAVIASFGRLSYEKGYSYLIESIKILRDKYKLNAKLLLVGDGPDRGKLETQVYDSDLSDHCLFTGYIDNAKNLLPLIDYYVISSITEGLPITLLEVMLSQTPIVTTNVGGIPHVVDHNKDALLVPPADPQAIAAAINNLCNNPSLTSSLIHSSSNKVAQLYSSKRMAIEYLKMYKSVVNSF